MKMFNSTFIVIITSLFLTCSKANVIVSKYQRLKSNCNTADDFAPCACRARLTGTVVHQDNRRIAVEFLESVCNIEENHRREKEGEIFEDYTCYQVRQKTHIHHDVYGKPVDVVVNRRVGCELRCVAKECGIEDKDLVDKITIGNI